MSKTLAQMVAEANAVVPTLSAAEAIEKYRAGEFIAIDVREANELSISGRIPGALHVPRGLLEFHADAASPMHKPEFSSGKPLLVFCASGGRSALAAQTLMELGFANVAHVAGGFGAWQQFGGEIASD
jgi:rhodanese-related sulfurtransferase